MPGGLVFASSVIGWITLVIAVASALLGVFAAVDAGSRRPDVFTAADRQTKGTWAAITIGSAVVFVLGFAFGGLFAATSLLWAAGMVGVLIYLVDVRPRLREVQRGTRW